MEFQVTGVDREGRSFVRHVTAESAETAAEHVRADGSLVSEVRESTPGDAAATPAAPTPPAPPASPPPSPPPVFRTPAAPATTPAAPPRDPAPGGPVRRGRLSATELVFFSTHLSGAARLGLPLPGALRSLAAEASRPAFRAGIDRIGRQVESGTALSTALQDERDSFPAFYVRALEAGERAGTLSPVLLLLADHLRFAMEIRRRLTEIIAYPVILLLALALIFALYHGIAAELMSSYEGMGMNLPLASRQVLRIAENAQPILLTIFGVPLLAFFLWRLLRGVDRVRDFVERTALRMPVYGHLLRSALTARFCHLAHLMLRAGVPAPLGMRLAADAMGNAIAARSIQDIARTMEEGGSAADGARGSRFLPATLVWMVQVGESRGELSETLREAAGMYETTFRHQIALLENVFGPVLVVLTGVFVLATMGAVVVLPLIHLMQGLL